jgi:tetratricopeptide (TPR) repeat protein
LPYVQKQTAYLERVVPTDFHSLAFAYQVLGNTYLGAKNPTEAIRAFRHAMDLQNRLKLDVNHDALMERKIGQAKAEENRLDEARTLCAHSLKTHIAFITGPNLHSAWDAFVLGRVEQQLGNLREAVTDYRLSVETNDKVKSLGIANTLGPDGFDSGTVVYSEHLANALLATHDHSPAVEVLQTRAKKVRALHPEWLTKDPDPSQHFAIWGHLPFQVDIIPTRRN